MTDRELYLWSKVEFSVINRVLNFTVNRTVEFIPPVVLNQSINVAVEDDVKAKL